MFKIYLDISIISVAVTSDADMILLTADIIELKVEGSSVVGQERNLVNFDFNS